jgi:hypothetical protein
MSLDLARTQRLIRRFVINQAFWVRDARTARAVMRKARPGLIMRASLAYVPGETAEEEIESAAGSLGVRLTEHQAALGRVYRALARVDEVLAQAHAEGALSWFNQAYRAYRLANTGRTMLYGEAKVRLRNAVVRRIMAGEALTDLQAEVFGELLLIVNKMQVIVNEITGGRRRGQFEGGFYTRAHNHCPSCAFLVGSPSW